MARLCLKYTCTEVCTCMLYIYVLYFLGSVVGPSTLALQFGYGVKYWRESSIIPTSCALVHVVDDVYWIPKPVVALQRLWTFGHESRIEVAWNKSLKHKRCWDWVHSTNWVKTLALLGLHCSSTFYIYDTYWRSAFLTFKDTAMVQIDVPSWYCRL